MNITLFATTLLLFYLYHMLGITIGYHRFIAHRSFKLVKPLEFLFVSGGYLCFEGSPIIWRTVHLLHHQQSDKPGDPHYSETNREWYAFIGWLFNPKVKITEAICRKECRELYQNPVYRFLQLPLGEASLVNGAVLCAVSGVMFRFLLWLVFGPTVLAANLLATAFCWCAPLLIGVICHCPYLGYRNFETKDESRNVWYAFLLALGDQYHNNHHRFARSARQGFRSCEFDFGWTLISLLAKARLAWDVVLPKRRVVICSRHELTGVLGEAYNCTRPIPTANTRLMRSVLPGKLAAKLLPFAQFDFSIACSWSHDRRTQINEEQARVLVLLGLSDKSVRAFGTATRDPFSQEPAVRPGDFVLVYEDDMLAGLSGKGVCALSERPMALLYVGAELPIELPALFSNLRWSTYRDELPALIAGRFAGMEINLRQACLDRGCASLLHSASLGPLMQRECIRLEEVLPFLAVDGDETVRDNLRTVIHYQLWLAQGRREVAPDLSSWLRRPTVLEPRRSRFSLSFAC